MDGVYRAPMRSASDTVDPRATIERARRLGLCGFGQLVREPGELNRVYEGQDVQRDQTIAVYGLTGVDAAHTFWIMRVLGYDKVVESLCTGGFPLDVEFSSTRLRELCKMDGAVVLSSDGTRIVRAAVHLMPDSTIPTEESGTRHRTAERRGGFPNA